jgi:mono/diheme cytochrome c family protein
VRIATAVAGGLALAAAVMAVLAVTSGGDGGGQSAAPATAGQTADGRAVWLAQGCGSCHTLAAVNAHGDIGPDLAATLKGAPASYVRESIVNPNAHAAAGYSTGTMPEDYESRMTPAELDRLVGFLRASAR